MTRGRFIVLDGPSGAGKSTAAQLLTDRLNAAGHPTDATCEPSDGPIGRLARAGTNDYAGLVLAHLITADRLHHLITTIRPAVAAGRVVVCDRYLPTSLVLQTLDGVPAETVWQLNAHIDRPDLTIVLLGDADRCRQRAMARGTYSRFHRHLPHEPNLYQAVAARLRDAGWPTITYDIGAQPAGEVAAALSEHVQQLLDH